MAEIRRLATSPQILRAPGDSAVPQGLLLDREMRPIADRRSLLRSADHLIGRRRRSVPGGAIHSTHELDYEDLQLGKLEKSS